MFIRISKIYIMLNIILKYTYYNDFLAKNIIGFKTLSDFGGCEKSY